MLRRYSIIVLSMAEVNYVAAGEPTMGALAMRNIPEILPRNSIKLHLGI